MQSLPVHSVFDYYNLATGDNVRLEVTEAEGISCKGCYFDNIQRHCPDDYACGQFARKDKQAVIFKLKLHITFKGRD